MHKLLVPILLTLAAVCRLYGATESYPVSGRVIDRLTRQPVPFAAVVILFEQAQSVVLAKKQMAPSSIVRLI